MSNYIVYKHTAPNGKVYIGITCRGPAQRWNNGRGYDYNAAFRSDIEKYGWNNFGHEILISGLSLHEANQKEIELIAAYDSMNPSKGYNQTPGGGCCLSGEQHPLYGRTRPADVVEKVAAKKRGKPISERQREAIKEYYKTHKVWNYGLKTPPEVVEKLRLSHMGHRHPHSIETIQKITESNKKLRKPVVKLSLSGEPIAQYESITAAAREYGAKKCTKENIRQCCHGMKKSAYGHRWKFAEEETRCTI